MGRCIKQVKLWQKREYLYGYELDSVMNYPYRDALINYTLGKIDAKTFCRKIEIIRENYLSRYMNVL